MAAISSLWYCFDVYWFILFLFILRVIVIVESFLVQSNQIDFSCIIIKYDVTVRSLLKFMRYARIRCIYSGIYIFKFLFCFCKHFMDLCIHFIMLWIENHEMQQNNVQFILILCHLNIVENQGTRHIFKSVLFKETIN